MNNGTRLHTLRAERIGGPAYFDLLRNPSASTSTINVDKAPVERAGQGFDAAGLVLCAGLAFAVFGENVK